MNRRKEKFLYYFEVDKHECNLLLNRINATLTSQSLFVAAAAVLYGTLQGTEYQRLVVTVVSAIGGIMGAFAFVAIALGCRILRRWHQHGDRLIDEDEAEPDMTQRELDGLYLLPRRYLPDWTHTISLDLFGYLMSLTFVVFWVLCIVWIQFK